MKKIWYLFAAVCTLTFMACDDEDPVGIDSGSELEVLSADEKIELAGGSGVIKIKTTATEITATSDAEWLTITKWTPTAVGFVVAENNDGVKRVANITITGGTLKLVVKVTQNGPQIDLGFEEKTFEAGGGTGEIPFTVEGAEVSARAHVDWLIVDKVEDGKIFFTVAEYGLKNQRAGAITVKAGEVTDVVTIYQKGAYFEMSNKAVSLAANGSAATEIPYTTNLSSDPQVVMTPADASSWLTVSFADGKMILTPKANFTTDREVDLTITGGWQTVNIKATQKAVTVFDMQKFIVDRRQHTFEVKTNENIAYVGASWDIVRTDDATWYTITKNADGFTINITANDTNKTRTSSLNLLDSDGYVFATLPIKQKLYDVAWFLGDWTFTYDKDGKEFGVTRTITLQQHADDASANKSIYDCTRLQIKGIDGNIKPIITVTYEDTDDGVRMFFNCNKEPLGKWYWSSGTIERDCYVYGNEGGGSGYGWWNDTNPHGFYIVLDPDGDVNTLTWEPVDMGARDYFKYIGHQKMDDGTTKNYTLAVTFKPHTLTR